MEFKDTHKFSSTQINLPDLIAARIRRFAKAIPDDQLAEDGREDNPHVTIKYGLHTDDAEDVRPLLEGEPQVNLEFGKTAIFPANENADYDVVIVGVTSPDLERLNGKLSDELDHTDTHSDYKPHATIAYVVAGEGEQYAGDTFLDGTSCTVGSVVFSSASGDETEIDLAGESTEVKTMEKSETLVNFGSEVKATDSEKIGGYLVLFSSADSPDLAKDFFSKDTDFGIVDGAKTAVYFNHRMPLKTKDKKSVVVREKIGEGTLTIDAKGVLVDAILYNRKEYEDALTSLGWSSGTAAHLVDREKKGKASFIKTWPLGLDASITPSPAEPRTQVVSLKSFLDEQSAEPATKTMKGIFEEELAEQTPSFWQLQNILGEVARDIAQAVGSSDITGVTVDVNAKVTEAVMEFCNRIVPIITAQINDFVEKGDESYFYLKATSAIFNSLIDSEGSPRTGLRLQEHSETVLTAARELGANATATCKAASALAERFEGKHDLDIKAGRELSSTNRERIKKHHDEIMAAKDQLHAVAGSLMEIYEKTDPDKPKSADAASINRLAAEWAHQRLLYAGTV